MLPPLEFRVKVGRGFRAKSRTVLPLAVVPAPVSSLFLEDNTSGRDWALCELHCSFRNWVVLLSFFEPVPAASSFDCVLSDNIILGECEA